MSIQIDTGSEAHLSPKFPGTIKSTPYEKESFNTKKVSKRESWQKEHAILANSWND